MPESTEPASGTRGASSSEIGPRAAAALVFGSSAAVLVVELTALRLLAPYIGLTLEANTLVIGLALAAIAIGSWAGGLAADRIPPRRALGPLLAVPGVVVAATPFLMRGAGELDSGLLLFWTAALTIGIPGALLSAVTPMVTKLRLTRLAETGTVVGRLSGIATAGAIAGTVLTGFVLVSRLSVTTILVSLGVLLVAAAAVVEWRIRGPRAVAIPAALVGLGGLAAVVAPGDCDVETTYHCAQVVADPERETGRVLELDGVRNSYVDTADPTYLGLPYVEGLASVVDTAFPDGEPVAAYHLGGGALTMPRYLDEVRPGSTSVVSEVDPGVVDLNVELLGLAPQESIDVRVEDARLGLRRLDDDSRDLVIGDAFSGVSIPFHLTTREALTDVRRVLTAEGAYVANLIDNGPLDFARAETATLADVFEHVAVAAEPDTFTFEGGGNLVVVASDEPIEGEALAARLEERDTGWTVLTGPALVDWIGDAAVLTDDRAPVDQLLTAYGR